jgi:hypothetical protein
VEVIPFICVLFSYWCVLLLYFSLFLRCHSLNYGSRLRFEVTVTPSVIASLCYCDMLCVFRYHGYLVGFTIETLPCGYCCVVRVRICVCCFMIMNAGWWGKEDMKKSSVTSRGGPWGCETSRLPHFLDNLLTDGGEVVSLARRPCLYSHNGSWY